MSNTEDFNFDDLLNSEEDLSKELSSPEAVEEIAETVPVVLDKNSKKAKKEKPPKKEKAPKAKYVKPPKVKKEKIPREPREKKPWNLSVIDVAMAIAACSLFIGCLFLLLNMFANGS